MHNALSSFVLAAAVGYVGRHVGALTPGGAVGAALIGGAVHSAARPGGTLALLTFFASSSALTRLPGGRSEGDHGGRNLRQAIANGGVAALGAALHTRRPGGSALCVLGGALSAAAADTWATELGGRYGGTPRLVTTLRPVPVGRDGAVTPLGCAASVVGGLLPAAALAAACSSEQRAHVMLCCWTGGVVGSLTDSLLGAAGGRRWAPVGAGLDNDAVNLLATLAGGVAASALFAIAHRPRSCDEDATPVSACTTL
ncbi:MAG: DUF92 domain-containing protein [Chloroflexia bacterium]